MGTVSTRDEWARRRNETLTYYPDVARVGNLADALTEALAETVFLHRIGSLSFYEPVFSPFNDHPDAPGMTVPEFASVTTKGRKCDVSIALFEFPLGMYGLTFFVDGATEHLDSGLASGTIITGDLGTIIVDDLATVALVISSALEDGAELSQLAQASGAIYAAPARFKSGRTMDASVNRILANIRAKLDSTDPEDQERVRRAARP